MVDRTCQEVDDDLADRASSLRGQASQFRFEFNYGYGRLNGAGLEGRTNFYQLRLQFQL